MPTLIEQQKIDKARASARAQVDWYAENQLYYDKPPKPGKASWGLALHPHFITQEHHQILTTDTPQVIADYHRVSAHLMGLALDPSIRGDLKDLEKMYQVLTFTNPPETEFLWKEMLSMGKTMPASSRPDILISSDPGKLFQHIECNADGSADKGNTLGVAKVTRDILGFPTVGVGLDQGFINGIRHQLPHHDRITVATVVPDNYRTEYLPQDAFFAAQGNKVDGIDWITAKVSQLTHQPTGVFLEDRKIDIVDREVKAPGFTDSHDFQPEMDLYKAILEQKVELFGSVLPHGDKLFLAALFDPALESIVKGVVGEVGLARLRAFHPSTHLFDPAKKVYQFGSQEYSINDIKHPDKKGALVFKHTGDNTYTTGSNGVYISKGYKSENWENVVDEAMAKGIGKRTHLIVQELVESQRFAIQAISSTTAEPKEYTVPVRFAPYYVWDGDQYVLADVLVTSGTDREVVKLNSLNIHGQRENTYQGVVVGGGA